MPMLLVPMNTVIIVIDGYDDDDNVDYDNDCDASTVSTTANANNTLFGAAPSDDAGAHTGSGSSCVTPATMDDDTISSKTASCLPACGNTCAVATDTRE